MNHKDGEPPSCRRNGCTRWAHDDGFCSSACFRLHHGIPVQTDALYDRKWLSDEEWRREKRRRRYAREKHGASTIAVPNEDAMNYRLPGHFEGNSR